MLSTARRRCRVQPGDSARPPGVRAGVRAHGHHFVVVLRVARAAERRAAAGDCGRADQGQRRGILQVREGRGGVGGRRPLPAPGQRRLGIGWERGDDPSVVLAHARISFATCGADLRAPPGEGRRIIAELAPSASVRAASIARRGRVDGQDVVGGLGGRGVGRRIAEVAQPDAIRLEFALDGVDGVEHRDVGHREEAGCERVLRDRDGVLQNLVPFENDVSGRVMGAYRLGRRVSTTPTPAWPRSVVFCAWKSPHQ